MGYSDNMQSSLQKTIPQKNQKNLPQTVSLSCTSRTLKQPRRGSVGGFVVVVVGGGVGVVGVNVKREGECVA